MMADSHSDQMNRAPILRCAKGGRLARTAWVRRDNSQPILSVLYRAKIASIIGSSSRRVLVRLSWSSYSVARSGKRNQVESLKFLIAEH